MSFRGRGEVPHSIELDRKTTRRSRSSSQDSHAPLSPRPMQRAPTYPTEPHTHIDIQEPSPTIYPPNHGQFAPVPEASPTSGTPQRPMPSRSSSWDMFSGVQKDWENYDSRNASNANFQFAQGDIPNNKVTKAYNYLINASIVTRWFIFIVPILALLWIPGILSLTAFPSAHIWHVRLLWWSVWLSIIWGGWWAALAVAMMLPKLLRHTLGLAAVSLRKYFEWLTALQRPVAFVGWSIAVFVSFNPVINNRFTAGEANDFPSSRNALTLVGRLCFGILLCALILFAEKFAIQWVAYTFHQTSYADRIAVQKRQLECLIHLYRNSSDIPGRHDTLPDNTSARGAAAMNPSKIFRKALKGVRRTAQTTTGVLGNLATEIAGTSMLQPNSPAAMVSAALGSANKTKMLARRLFYSFRTEGSDRLIFGDISRFFPNREMSTYAFEIFDRDENGDATREEIEAALMEIHTERLSLAASMKDVDSATGRLDNILISIYSLIVILIFAIMLDASVSTIVTGVGTFVLGLSWLIGSSVQEVLTSIIFLFVKHPFDIGDNVEFDGASYTVKEIHLLSTIMVDSRGSDVQCPNVKLNGSNIVNKRRSGPMSEAFEFVVGYNTTFEQIEDLRARMLRFIKDERRDFLPIFDIFVLDIPEQSNMKLKVDIKYKSNWQMGALKAQRRNKWVCALKNALLECKIFGPTGDPNAPAAGPQEITLVPYESVAAAPSFPVPQRTPDENRSNWAFMDNNNALFDSGAGAVFGEEGEILGGPTAASSAQGSLRARNVGAQGQGQPGAMPHPQPYGGVNEEIEMVPHRGNNVH